jgi:uncharacterized membrane protein YgcG
MSAQPRWDVPEPTRHPESVRSPKPQPERGPARVLSAIALASIAAGAINIAAAATVGRDSNESLAFFAMVGVAQIAWGLVALVRAPRWWLALGAAGNLAVVATWLVSRTVALPFGPYAGITLPVGFSDGLATALEAVTVVGAAALMVRGRGPARSAARSPGVAAAAAVLIGALAIFGVLSQAGASGSSPAGSQGNGGGGQSGPYAPGNGGGSSGGGTSGGGLSGGYGY